MDELFEVFGESLGALFSTKRGAIIAVSLIVIAVSAYFIWFH